MLKICNAPKGCLFGAIRGSMERKPLLCHLASVSKFSWNSGRERSDLHYSLIFFFFFPSPWCFFSTRSQQPWKLREWQMAIGKTWVSRKSAEMLFNWQGKKKKKKRRNENRNKISSVFGPRVLPGICQFIHPEIWRDSRWKHFHFFLLSLYFIGILVVTIWEFPSTGLRKKLRQLLKIYRNELGNF